MFKPISYTRAVQYATIFVGHERARDLVHDLYLSLYRKKIDLFTTSKRFVYVCLHNLFCVQNYQSIAARRKAIFLDITDHHISRGANPEQIMIAQELEATLTDFLRLRVEGYTQAEIGEKTGYSREWVGKKMSEAITNNYALVNIHRANGNRLAHYQ